MVKKMDDYENRMSDKRFEKFDRLISNNENDRKFAIVVTVGIIISAILLVGSTVLQSQSSPSAMRYDYGLNISYSPEASSYFIDYTNPNSTAKSLLVDISILMNTGVSTVYTREVSEFPTNISYKPSNPEFSHIVSVNIVKETGNYTYFYSNIPSDDDKLYNGMGKYIDPLKNVIS